MKKGEEKQHGWLDKLHGSETRKETGEEKKIIMEKKLNFAGWTEHQTQERTGDKHIKTADRQKKRTPHYQSPSPQRNFTHTGGQSPGFDTFQKQKVKQGVVFGQNSILSQNFGEKNHLQKSKFRGKEGTQSKETLLTLKQINEMRRQKGYRKKEATQMEKAWKNLKRKKHTR